MHQQFAATLNACHDRTIRAIQQRGAHWSGSQLRANERCGGRLIVLRTPKGWTGPKVVDGKPVEGTFRAHQVPLAEGEDRPRPPGATGSVDAQL